MLLDTDLLIFSLVFQNLHQIGPDSSGSGGGGVHGPVLGRAGNGSMGHMGHGSRHGDP